MAPRGNSRSRLLLVILLVTALFLITLDLRGVSLISSTRLATQTILSPIQGFTSRLFAPIGNFFSDVSHLGRSGNEIEALQKENEALKAKLVLQKDLKGKLTQLKSVLNLAGEAQYKIVSARVIARGSATSFSQTITIDAGSSSGIARDMTVISGAGLVGSVKSVTANSAVILLMSDPTFRIGVRVAGSQVMGILSGTGSRNFELELLDATETVKIGDVLLARGSDGGKPFVPGIPVGLVINVDSASGQLTKHGRVSSYAKLTSLGIVSVVISETGGDPRDGLVPPKPIATPTPTVTITVTPTPSPSA